MLSGAGQDGAFCGDYNAPGWGPSSGRWGHTRRVDSATPSFIPSLNTKKGRPPVASDRSDRAKRRGVKLFGLFMFVGGLARFLRRLLCPHRAFLPGTRGRRGQTWRPLFPKRQTRRLVARLSQPDQSAQPASARSPASRFQAANLRFDRKRGNSFRDGAASRSAGRLMAFDASGSQNGAMPDHGPRMSGERPFCTWHVGERKTGGGEIFADVSIARFPSCDGTGCQAGRTRTRSQTPASKPSRSSRRRSSRGVRSDGRSCLHRTGRGFLDFATSPHLHIRRHFCFRQRLIS
jgi:hypothetical protein